MEIELIKLPTETLLGKFGVGNHIPGSGSAAALQGMLSAQLISTVITLTSSEKKRNDYSSILPKLNTISSEIGSRIYPRLQELFQQDSEQFDSTIQLRVARDNEKKFKRSKELDQQAQAALKLATETMVEVGNLGIELGDFATFLFDNAVKAVRGDSGVALYSAVAVVAGCLSIINLNLLTIDDNTWVENIRLEIREQKLQYERLLVSANASLSILEKEVEIDVLLKEEIQSVLARKQYTKKLSNADIENLAVEVQNILWKYRRTIWKRNRPETPREVLRPNVAIEKLLKYKIIRRESLGVHDIYGESVEVAGIIDNDNKAIGISKKFSSEVQNFTLAHELGHALLHVQTGLHRDRPVDGFSGAKGQVEMQADKFATFFLMPKKQIIALFEEIFHMGKFSVTEDNVFALTGGSLKSFRSKCRNLRELSRIIASAESYYGNPFKSIAEVFGVSIEAMAIRLEELDLVEFETTIPSEIPAY